MENSECPCVLREDAAQCGNTGAPRGEPAWAPKDLLPPAQLGSASAGLGPLHPLRCFGPKGAVGGPPQRVKSCLCLVGSCHLFQLTDPFPGLS